MRNGRFVVLSAAIVLALGFQLEKFGGASAPEQDQPDVVYVPTPPQVVETMLKLANVGPDDVVYDLGCGDGRIVIAAARDFGASGVCVELDPERAQMARDNVRRAGVGDRVEVRRADLFETDVSDATVVTLYLLESLNVKLRPKLMDELRPGARIVSQSFGMGGTWEPDATRVVDGTPVYLWVVPDRR